MKTKRLYRSCNNRILGGVAGGLGEYLDIDPTIIRLVFLVLILSGIGFAAYIIAWVIIPLNPKCDTQKTGADEIKDKAEEIASDITEAGSHDKNLKTIIGTIIVALGLLILFENFFGQYIWKIFWPAAFVLIGLYFIANSEK